MKQQSTFVNVSHSMQEPVKSFTIQPSSSGEIAILIVAMFYYAAKAFLMFFMWGLEYDILLATSPAIVYLLAAVVYGVAAILSKDTSAIEAAVRRMFYLHIGWFVFRVACYVPNWFEPVMFDNILPRQTIWVLIIAFPISLLVTFVWSAFFEKQPPS